MVCVLSQCQLLLVGCAVEPRRTKTVRLGFKLAREGSRLVVIAHATVVHVGLAPLPYAQIETGAMFSPALAAYAGAIPR